MFRAASLELLARSRRPRLTNGGANHRNGFRAALLREHSDTAPTEDPDDVIDPDDSGPRLSVTLKESSVDGIAMPDLLDSVVLRTMPPRVAAFMLYEPRDPPPWRRQETGAEREFREQREEDGVWTG